MINSNQFNPGQHQLILNSQGIETFEDKQLILPENTQNNSTTNERPEGNNDEQNTNNTNFQLKNGIWLPKNTQANIELITGKEANQYLNKNDSPRERLMNSVESVINSENTATKHAIAEFFNRIIDENKYLHQTKNDDKTSLKTSKTSISNIQVNRELSDGTNYYPLKPFSVTEKNKDILQKLITDSIQPSDRIKNSFLKRFSLKMLSNTSYIQNLDNQTIIPEVINALKTDPESSAQKIYQYYLSNQIDNLSEKQMKQILDICQRQQKLSSHLAQSILTTSPELKAGMNSYSPELPKNFDELTKFLDKINLKDFNNMVDIVPHTLKADENGDQEKSTKPNFGIEIEMKLAGKNNFRDENSPIQLNLKNHLEDFAELGIDYATDNNNFGTIAELRTKGPFKLDQESLTKLYNIINKLNAEPDLVTFLSNHVHLDNKENSQPNNNCFHTLINTEHSTKEAKFLDIFTENLNPNTEENLRTSYNLPSLVDGMVILETLNSQKISKDVINNVVKLNKKFPELSLNSLKLLSLAVDSGQETIIPNILRLENHKKNHFPSFKDRELIFQLLNNQNSTNLVLNHNLDFSKTRIQSLPDNLKINGDLDLSESQINHIGSMTRINGVLNLYGTENIHKIPDDCEIQEGLMLLKSSVAKLPEKLKLNRDLILDHSQVTQLPKDLEIGGTLQMSKAKVNNFPNNFKSVGEDLHINVVQLANLPDNFVIGGDLHLWDYNEEIQQFPKNLTVQGNLMLGSNFVKDTNPEGLRIEKNLFYEDHEPPQEFLDNIYVGEKVSDLFN